MTTNILTEDVKSQLKNKGVSEEAVLSQIETFENGIPFTELIRPCTLGDGIENFDSELEKYVEIYETQASSRKVIKFVPASGAASRMFKELLSVSGRDGEITRKALEDAEDKESKSFIRFIDDLEKFAFYNDLKKVLSDDGLDINQLIDEGKYKAIADYSLGEKGLNYANLPKGIIEFHKYENGTRTAFEEHLVEAREYSRDSSALSRVHFTVSPEYLEMVKALLNHKMGQYEVSETKFDITYSIQKPSTDTIAVTLDNLPFLDNDGSIVLRPGGHGALIENLNDLDCDIAFIKNIDNVVPDRLKPDTYSYKKALGGYLIVLQEMVFEYLDAIDQGHSDEEFIENIALFLKDNLNIELPTGFEEFTKDEKTTYFRQKLNRPIRLCGVVKNVGEPGGGPFWVKAKDGSLTKQIVESSQVDMASQESIWLSSTHFNPVDIVCGLKDYKGEPFDLREYVDPDMGFISHKSKDGRDLKALELPGLWNGAMADWNTLFIEVPLITFNPVKTVFDLLRPEHRPEEQ